VATRPAVAVSEPAPTRPRHGPIDWMGGWKLCVWGWLAVVVLTALRWWYISRHAWTVGIGAASPEFTKYFRTAVWAELMVIGAGTSLWWGWLVRTGRRLIDQAVTFPSPRWLLPPSPR
jgi:methane/ammonia monooxygenase subunit C